MTINVEVDQSSLWIFTIILGLDGANNSRSGEGVSKG